MATVSERPAGDLGTGTAAGLILPATVFVAIGLIVPIAILFRYSLNAFVPGKMMVDALTIDNYVKFFTDPFYLQVLWRTIRVSWPAPWSA